MTPTTKTRIQTWLLIALSFFLTYFFWSMGQLFKR